MITKALIGTAVLSAACFGMPVASAADASIALSVGFVNENPPVVVVGGSGVNADPEQARIASLNDCVAKGGGGCVTQVIATNACAAIGSNDFGEFTGVQNANLQAARGAATAGLSNQQGARVVIAGCSQSQLPPGAIEDPPSEVVDEPVAPPPPSPTPVPCQPQPYCEHWQNLPTFPFQPSGS